MKSIFIILFVLLFHAITFTNTNQDYQQNMLELADEWKETYLHDLTNSSHIQTLIDLVLLSYKITHESCQMILAKLIIQEELLKIYTPSLIDSWQTNMQIVHNDTTKLEHALSIIKQTQINLVSYFEKLKMIAPNLLPIKPQPTQTMIANLKQGLLEWTTQQEDIKYNIDELETEFTTALANITDVKTIFAFTLHSDDVKQPKLREAAGYVSKTYKDIETVLEHFTSVRKISVYRINAFFTLFFKTYYNALYEALTPAQQQQIKTFATPTEKLPLADEFFVDFATL